MFQHNIKRLRIAKNMGQEDLAEALGVSRNAVSKWENGQSAPRMGMAKQIADYFGITVSELVSEQRQDNETGYKLNDSEYKLLNAFRELPMENQALVMQLIKALL